ncbi:MAG: HAD family hydrolase [Oligoflexia bacterium]|nr:HAD family hydrolase [Oligoflexia bacterium]
MATTKKFIFDFDGVLFESARECFAVAVNTARLPKWKSLINIDTLSDEDLAPRFLEKRYFVGPPWQYAVLLKLLAKAQLPETSHEFLKVAEKYQSEFIDFSDDYYKTRERLSLNSSHWTQNVRAFEKPLQLFLKLVNQDRAWILSSRDESSIHRIFDAVVGIKLDPGLIIPKPPHGQTKAMRLQETAKRTGLEPNEILFIDDYVHHLAPAQELGFDVALSTWGYLGEEDRREALALNIPQLKIDELGSFIERKGA